MTFTGTISAINAALNGLTFQASAITDGLKITAINPAAAGNASLPVSASVPIQQAPLIPPSPSPPNPGPTPIPTPTPVPTPVTPSHNGTVTPNVVPPVAPSVIPVAPPASTSSSGPAIAPAVTVSTRKDATAATSLLMVGYQGPMGSTTVQPAPRAIGAVRNARDVGGLLSSTANVFWEDLNDVRDQLSSTVHSQAFVIGSALTVSTGLTVGYVMWMLRGGMLLSSLMAQLPAWSLIDPLVILSRMDDAETDVTREGNEESLESILAASASPSPNGEGVGA
jgi:hypothetical protein